MRLLQDHRAIRLTPNNTKFDQTFSAFKRDLDEKEAATQSQLKKLKTETKASSSFNFKGNKVQYEFDSSLLEVIDGVVDKISRGNLSAANSELERVKSLIAKRYKLVRFADKSPAGWTAIEEYESDELADDSEDEKKLRSAERRALVKIREKKRKHASNCSNSTATHPKPIEGPSTGLSTGSSFSPNQPFFRMQSFRGRQPQPADKCFSCGQRGLWANSSVCPSRFRGSVPAVPNSKMAN